MHDYSLAQSCIKHNFRRMKESIDLLESTENYEIANIYTLLVIISLLRTLLSLSKSSSGVVGFVHVRLLYSYSQQYIYSCHTA